MKKQEAFLNNLAAKLGRPRKSGITPPEWNAQPYEHLYEGKQREELIQQFITNLESLSPEVDRISRSELGTAIQKVISKFRVGSAILWDDERLHELNMLSLLTENNVNSVCWSDREDPEQLRRAAATVDLGITFADMGLAEAGTVMLFNGGGKGRVVSLLPPCFLCILREDQIVPRLTQAVQHIHRKVPEGLPACINFITGPSRTGDIEMDLALGVHGPGKVHVILLKD